jgi:hypothetical protein
MCASRSVSLGLFNAHNLNGHPTPVSQRVKKRRVIFERISSTAPNYLRFRVSPGQFGNQDVKAVIGSAALIMDNGIIASYGCSN